MALDSLLSPRARQWVSVFLVGAIIVDLWWALAAPYLAAYFGLNLHEPDRAIIGQVVTAINNAFMLIVGYFFGLNAKTESKP